MSIWCNRKQQQCILWLLVVALVCISQHCSAFRIPPHASSSSLHHRTRRSNALFATAPQPSIRNNKKNALLGVFLKQVLGTSASPEAQLVGRRGLYRREMKVDPKLLVAKSSLYKFVQIATNPLAVIFGVYFFIYGVRHVVYAFNLVFNREAAMKQKEKLAAEVKNEDQPFQVFQCERCGMHLRPARGRAEKIFANERFRCARCGSKASAYFNIEDMSDPRAVARIEKLKREKEERDRADYGDDEE